MVPSLNRDLYKDLDVPRDAPLEEIKSAWLEAAFKFHPDTHDGTVTDKEAAIKFQNARAAYRILSDPQARAEYDRQFVPVNPLDALRSPYRGPADLPNSNGNFRPIRAAPIVDERLYKESSPIIERTLAAARKQRVPHHAPPLVKNRLLSHAERKARRVAQVEPRGQTVAGIAFPIVCGLAWIITVAKVTQMA